MNHDHSLYKLKVFLQMLLVLISFSMSLACSGSQADSNKQIELSRKEAELAKKETELLKKELELSKNGATNLNSNLAEPSPSRETSQTKVKVRKPSTRAECESGHWIESVSSDGSIIKLEDGSIWKVDSVDVVVSTLWLPVTDVLVCDDKIINTDDNESVDVTRLK